MPTKLWDVQTSLVSVFDGATAPAVEVFPGPRRDRNAPKQFILVGSDGGTDGLGATEDGMFAQQSLSTMGPGTWRDETGTVTCSAWSWTGNRTIDSARAAAKDLLAACETALSADRRLAGLLTATGMAEITDFAIRESQGTGGPVVRAVFTVSYGALITP